LCYVGYVVHALGVRLVGGRTLALAAIEGVDVRKGDLVYRPLGVLDFLPRLGESFVHLGLAVRVAGQTLVVLDSRLGELVARAPKLSCGSLREGGDADLVVFDERERWTVGSRFFSKSSNSPFTGMTLYGRVKYTLCGGRVVYTDGKDVR